MADISLQKQKESTGKEVKPSRSSSGPGSLWPSFSLMPNDLFNMNPFSLMRIMSEEMDRSFRGTGGSRMSGSWTPAIEVKENDGNLVICADLPGMDQNDLKVEVRDNALVLEGERKQEQEDDSGGVHRSERFYGRFHRMIPLPEGADIDKAHAKFQNGVLEIDVPIPASAQKTKRIPIDTK